MQNSRYEKGWEKFQDIGVPKAENIINSLSEISPDLARFTIEFAFGDVYTRPGLDIQKRELVTIAALITLGSQISHLKVHINGALNVGCTQQEIIEVIIQMAVYAGFPAAINAMFAANDVFEDRNRNK